MWFDVLLSQGSDVVIGLGRRLVVIKADGARLDAILLPWVGWFCHERMRMCQGFIHAIAM